MNFTLRLFLLIALIAACGVAHAETAFTYQGRLGNAGQPADGLHDFRFRLFDDASAGGQVGVEQAVPSVDVDAGIFTVLLDFGDGPFNAAPRWLEIAVREAGAAAYTTLTPRQRIGAAPFAIETLFVAPGAVDTAALQDNAVTSSKIASGAVNTAHVVDGTLTGADVQDGSLSGADVQDGSLHAADFGDPLYTAKNALDSRTVSKTMSGTSDSVVATCADANDLPISAACDLGPQGTPLLLKGMRYSDWLSSENPAQVECVVERLAGTSSISISASLYCLEVP